MSTNAVLLEIDGASAAHAFEEAIEHLDSAGGELILDLSSVRRLDSESLGFLEKLLEAADAKSVKLVLRGVAVDVYRVLKLMKLSPRFEFAA